MSNIFETPNLDLGAYLMVEGIRYLGCRIDIDSRRQEPQAVLKFLDEKENCRDLERCFMTSRDKKYRDLHKYLLKDIHQEVRQFNRKVKERAEE